MYTIAKIERRRVRERTLNTLLDWACCSRGRARSGQVRNACVDRDDSRAVRDVELPGGAAGNQSFIAPGRPWAMPCALECEKGGADHRPASGRTRCQRPS